MAKRPVPPKLVPVDDIDDPRLVDYRNIRDGDIRGRPGLFVGEQALVVAQMLALPGVTKSVLVAPEKVAKLAALAGDDVPIYVAPLELLSAIAGFPVHRGILAVGHRAAFDSRSLADIVPPAGAPGCVLACEGITHVDNIGLLFRNAAAFGVSGVLLDPTCHDPLYRKAVRVSIGHVLTVPWAWSGDWLADLAELRDVHQLTLIGAALTPNAVPLDELTPSGRSTLVVGTEFGGLRPATLAHCDHVVRIPMATGVDSLNVAVAAAVCLHRLCGVGRV
jgi:tRNA G18 (ribose-2'-O)-methylase SpoU